MLLGGWLSAQQEEDAGIASSIGEDASTSEMDGEAPMGEALRNVVVDEETVSSMKWLRLRKLVYHDAVGRRREWESAERTTRKGAIDGVAIVALLRCGEDETSVVVVRQFRPPLNRVCLELPAGLVDEDETVSEAAMRELREETGYVGVDARTSPVLGCDPGMSNANMQLVVVDVYEEQRGAAQPDDGEHIEVVRMPTRTLAADLRRLVEEENFAVDARLYSLAQGLELGGELERLSAGANGGTIPSDTSSFIDRLCPVAWRVRLKYSMAALRDLATSRHVYLSTNFLVLMCAANVLEEFLYTHLRGFEFYWSLAGLELLVFASASLWRATRASTPDAEKHVLDRPSAPVYLYAVTGATMAFSQSLGKVANKYVNFTVSTIFKCAKVVPTMILGATFLNRRYRREEIISALSMSASATFFALGAAEVDVSFNTLGVVYNTLYLVFQSAQVILQDYALRDYGASVNESMLYANFFGFAVVFVVIVCSGELAAAVLYFAHHGPKALVLVIVRTLFFYIAVRSYSTIIKESGGVAAVLVGIFRKIATVVLSSIIYPKEYSHTYPIGAFFLLVSIVCELRTGIKKAAVKAREAKLGGNSSVKASSNDLSSVPLAKTFSDGTTAKGSSSRTSISVLDGIEKGNSVGGPTSVTSRS